MPITSPGNDDDTGENHQPHTTENTPTPVRQTLKQNSVAVKPSDSRGFRQAGEHEDNVGVLGGFPRPDSRARSAGSRSGVKPGAKSALMPRSASGVEGAGHLGGGDVGAAALSKAGCGRIRR